MNTVKYECGGKYAVYDGLRFCRDENTGYYLNSTRRIRLHRYVYEKNHGDIPFGYEVHHVDHDRGNNEPENLVMLSSEDHRRIHAEELTDEQRQARRDNMINVVIPSAADWHRSASGHEWHRKHYAETADKLHVKTTYVCQHCGRQFVSTKTARVRFCSNTCRSAHRRKGGIDDVQRICPCCGRSFRTNKYRPKASCSRSCANRIRSKNKADPAYGA